MIPPARQQRRKWSGFSLLEILVASAVLILILAMSFTMMSGASAIWQRQRSQSAVFAGANAAYESLTRSLAQATLATYWGYAKDGNGRPIAFRRDSDLHFQMNHTAELLGLSADRYPGTALFFQAPEGRTTLPGLKRLPSLLNGLGYFTAFGDVPNKPAILDAILPARFRFRLMEWQEPVEDLAVYEAATGDAWFASRVVSSNGTLQNTAVLAENIVALILMAEYPGAGGSLEHSYIYDSRNESEAARMHQLPPRVQVLMLAISEASAIRLAEQHGENPPPLAPGADLFVNPGQFENDIGKWETALKAIKPAVEYRLFNSSIPLKNAKWSQ